MLIVKVGLRFMQSTEKNSLKISERIWALMVNLAYQRKFAFHAKGVNQQVENPFVFEGYG